MSTQVIEQSARYLKEQFPLAYYEDGCLWDMDGECVAKDIDRLIEDHFDGTTIDVEHSTGNPEWAVRHAFWNGADYIRQELAGDYSEAYKLI